MKLMFVSLLILCSFTWSASGRFNVIGPGVPLVAVAGEDLVLPCSIHPNISAVDMTVEWMRLDQADSVVHLYTDREDKIREQSVSYRGRTALFREELQKGNTSLKLSVVRVSDHGLYKCLVKSESWYDDTTFHVIAEVSGTQSAIIVEEHDLSGGIHLVCEAEGWNPEPEILWLNSEGVTLSAESVEVHKYTDGFTVKRRVTVYNGDSNKFICRVKQRHNMMSTEVTISEKSFASWRIAVIFLFIFALLIPFGIIGIISLISYGRKGERRKFKKEFENNKQYKVDVVLDINTAHPYLNLSLNEKEVWYGKKREDFKSDVNNFDDSVFILGKEGYQKSFYYEVQVRGKTDWTVGVAKENIKKNGEIILKPQYGFWTLSKGNHEYSPSVNGGKRNLRKIGVFVNYEDGVVLFYDVDAKSLIHSYTEHFHQKLYPIFSPGFKHGGKNKAPIVITPVKNNSPETNTTNKVMPLKQSDAT